MLIEEVKDWKDKFKMLEQRYELANSLGERTTNDNKKKIKKQIR